VSQSHHSLLLVRIALMGMARLRSASKKSPCNVRSCTCMTGGHRLLLQRPSFSCGACLNQFVANTSSAWVDEKLRVRAV